MTGGCGSRIEREPEIGKGPNWLIRRKDRRGPVKGRKAVRLLSHRKDRIPDIEDLGSHPKHARGRQVNPGGGLGLPGGGIDSREGTQWWSLVWMDVNYLECEATIVGSGGQGEWKEQLKAPPLEVGRRD